MDEEAGLFVHGLFREIAVVNRLVEPQQYELDEEVLELLRDERAFNCSVDNSTNDLGKICIKSLNRLAN